MIKTCLVHFTSLLQSFNGLLCSLSFFNFLRLCKETMGDKRHMGVLSPVSKPSGLMKMELPRPHSNTLARLQAKDIGHYRSGRESHRSTAPQEAMVTRSSQSAPL